MAAQSKALTTTNVTDYLREWAPALKEFALTEFSHQQFFRTAALAITESEQLMDCMSTPAGRESLYNAMKRAFSTGLSLNPQEGKAAIIAYKGKASYQIMKEGAIDIVMRSGDVKQIMVETVYEQDDFSVEKSNAGDIYHFKPARNMRGNVDGYFCSLLDAEGVSHVKYMTQHECFEIRDVSSPSFKFNQKNSPWTSSPNGMCKKTVIKAAIRDLYLSPSAKSMFTAEDLSEQDLKPATKDVTPPRTGTTAAGVAEKIASGNKGSTETKSSDEPQADSPI